jgi:cytochrome c553
MRSAFSLACLALWASSANAQTPEQIEFFEKKVRPVLATKCQGCHNAKVKTAGLDLSTAAGFAAGGATGTLVAKTPDDSRLLKVIGYETSLKMPPMGKLGDEDIANLTAWVKMGTPWPGGMPMAATAGEKKVQWSEARLKHWAYQPLTHPAVPAVKNAAWARTALDKFLLAKLEAAGLAPAPAADKLTLLRRATLDLTGLPPTEAEIEAFTKDSSPDAFAKVVDRLLASPRYGERWGRHWLDVARFADSTGNDEDHRYPYAFQYRDYVIRAFNNDKPYNQFIREQIAGDMLPPHDGAELNKDGIVATGFLSLGAKALAQQDKPKMLYDIYDEQVDVTSKALLGITLACARCHDHKFDPLLQKDYYALTSMFANTRNFEDPKAFVSKLLYTPLVNKDVYAAYRAHQDKIAAQKDAIDDVVDAETDRRMNTLVPQLAAYLVAAKAAVAEGANLKQIAAEAKLDEKLLAKWVKYLKPGSLGRPHLEAWDHATPAQIAAVAQKYQDDYVKTKTALDERVAKWRINARKMRQEMNMPPPPKPTLKAEEAPFFTDVIANGGPFGLPPKEREAIFSAEAKAQLVELRRVEAELKKSAPEEPEMANSITEGEPVEQHVFIRGDYNAKGQKVSYAVPEILAGPADRKPTQGSGRREFAEWLVSPDNRLVTRVFVNRVFHWHFNEGIVRTPDNFGLMGEKPTHPELLDYLAQWFVKEGGWSVKKLHRELMLSSAYQMSSVASDEAARQDPENRLWSRFQRRRLSVEELRDGMLALDGTIDLTMGGTLQKGFGTDSENSNDRLSLNPEKLSRRTVYLPLRRANLPTLLNLFDFGDATSVNGKRANTNVAPQALFVMNSEFVGERARNIAQSVAGEAPARRAELLFTRLLNRKADAAEVDLALSYVAQLREKFPKLTELDAWQSLCRIYLGSNDFIYVD